MKKEKKKNHPEFIIEKQKKLKHDMRHEITVLREILGFIQEEQHYILMNDAEGLKEITAKKNQQIDDLSEARQSRLLSTKRLAKVVGYELTTEKEDVSFKELSKLTVNESDEACEILSLKNTTLALLDKVHDVTSSNNYLLQNKITLTKDLISNLKPKESNPTYGSQGAISSKIKTKTMTLINHEV